MARVFMDNFESGSLDLWSLVSTPAAVSTVGRDMRGDYCYCGDGGEAGQLVIPGGGSSEMFFAGRLRPRYSYAYFFTFYEDSYDSAERIGRIRIENDKLTAYVGTSKVATGTITLSTSTTYLVEVQYKVDGASGIIKVYIDGVLDINYSGDTQNGTLTTIKRLTIDSDIYLDNVIIDDAELPGDTEIGILAPSGAGTTTQWTPSSGSNYACVDEIPVSDTDYNAVNTVDQIDTYATEDMSTDCIIKCVQVQARMIKDGTPTPQNAAIAVRSGGTDYFSADKAVPSSYASLCNMWVNNPADSAAWEKADVNAMECGIKSRT